MSQSDTIELGPNDQDTVTFDVDENTDRLLVTLKSSEHQDVSTFPTWLIDGTEFPDEKQSIGEYPARLEPLGDVLELKIRNDHSQQDTEVTVGIRQKKLASA